MGKRLHCASVTENDGVFKGLTARGEGNVRHIVKSKTETREYKPLVTLCDALLRLCAGDNEARLATLEIPEVLIGGVNYKVDHLNYTNLRRCAGFFWPVINL